MVQWWLIGSKFREIVVSHFSEIYFRKIFRIFGGFSKDDFVVIILDFANFTSENSKLYLAKNLKNAKNENRPTLVLVKQ